MEKHTTIGVDIAKNVFEIAVSEERGRVCERQRVSRSRMMALFANRPAATVLLEACGSAHPLGRALQGFGHRVLLLPPAQVRRYVLRDKTDRTDAKALLEAYWNDQIVPVPVKTVLQHTLASVHRLRSGWMASRTARLNTLRGLLREFGITIPVGAKRVVPALSLALSSRTRSPSPNPDPGRRGDPGAGEPAAKLRRALRHALPLVGGRRGVRGRV